MESIMNYVYLFSWFIAIMSFLTCIAWFIDYELGQCHKHNAKKLYTQR